MTADLPSPHRPVHPLARSQSSSFASLVFPSCFWLSSLTLLYFSTSIANLCTIHKRHLSLVSSIPIVRYASHLLLAIMGYWADTILRQPVLSWTSSSVVSIALMYRLTQSIHLPVGLPTLVFPHGTHLYYVLHLQVHNSCRSVICMLYHRRWLVIHVYTWMTKLPRGCTLQRILFSLLDYILYLLFLKWIFFLLQRLIL